MKFCPSGPNPNTSELMNELHKLQKTGSTCLWGLELFAWFILEVGRASQLGFCKYLARLTLRKAFSSMNIFKNLTAEKIEQLEFVNVRHPYEGG